MAGQDKTIAMVEKTDPVRSWFFSLYEGFTGLTPIEQIPWIAGGAIPIIATIWGVRTYILPAKPKPEKLPIAKNVLKDWMDLPADEQAIVRKGIEGLEKVLSQNQGADSVSDEALIEAKSGDLTDITAIAEQFYQNAAIDLGASEKQLRLDKNNKAEAAINLASILLPSNAQRSYALFKEATELAPNNFWAWIERSKLARRCGVLSDMKLSAEQALNIANQKDDNREKAAAQMSIADHAILVGNLPDAVKHFESVSLVLSKRAKADSNNTDKLRDLSISHNRIGDIKRAQGDLTGALQSYQSGLEISEKLAKLDGSSSEWQRDLSVSYDRIGDIKSAQGDLTGALQSYQSGLEISEKLAKLDGSSSEWQRDLSVSYDRIGDIKSAQGDLTGALHSYQSGLEIRQMLAKLDGSSSEWQRDLIISNVKIAEVKGGTKNLKEALKIAQAMSDKGILNPVDNWMIDDLNKRLAAAV